MSIRSTLAQFFVGDEIRRLQLSIAAYDDARDRLWSRSNTEGTRDRYAHDRAQVLQDALLAWRTNPIANRIVGLVSDYVIGGGVDVSSKDQAVNAFLQAWWQHRLNRMPVRVFEWCDELTRSGDLFIAISTDAAGMSYVRAIPAADIADIETAPNDVEQEHAYIENVGGILTEQRRWPAYDPNNDNPQTAVMLHYSINRPVGAKFGESDLAPMLKWLTRYSDWLENRARLNRFRNAFVWVVKRFFGSESERKAYQAELNANPPNPGSVLVVNKDEDWSAASPKLESHEAGEDGLALKKMIAAGAAIPMHFLAEPESATRTTAEASGGPTYRHYDRRQVYFLWLLLDITQICVARRSQFDHNLNPQAPITLTGTDISTADNGALAEAAGAVVTAFIQLHDRGKITDEELVRMAYKFAGEIIDVDQVLKEAKKQWTSRPQPNSAPDSAAAPA